MIFQNSKVSIQGNALEYVREMAAILSRPQGVNKLFIFG